MCKIRTYSALLLQNTHDIKLPHWETDCFVDENTLTVNITRLRKKLEQAGLIDFIVTRKGMGYLISDED